MNGWGTLISPYLLEKVTEMGRYLYHYCPACDELHQYVVDRKDGNRPAWGFNGDLNKPSFTPSMLIRSGHYASGQKETAETCYLCNGDDESLRDICGICHYFVTQGKIQYCGDCTHDHKDKIVDLPAIPARYYEVQNDE